MKRLLLTVLAIIGVTMAVFGFTGCGGESSEAPKPPKAPTISIATTTLDLVVGYDKTESNAFNVVGDGVNVTLSFEKDGKSAQGYVVYDSSSKKLKIKSGLDAGVYKIKVTASNKGGSASVDFVIQVKERIYAEYSEETAALVLPYGYAACETKKFIVTGENVRVNVTAENNAEKFGWNETENKITIAEGLEKGEYPVTVAVTDGKSENVVVPFTVKVADVISGKNEMRLLDDYKAFEEKYELLGDDYDVTVVTPEGTENVFSFEKGALKVAEGLKKGEYAVTLKVGGGFLKDKKVDFNLAIKVAAPTARFTDEKGVTFNDDESVTWKGANSDYGTQRIFRDASGKEVASKVGEGFVLKFKTTVTNGTVDGGIYLLDPDGNSYTIFIQKENGKTVIFIRSWIKEGSKWGMYKYDYLNTVLEDGETEITLVYHLIRADAIRYYIQVGDNKAYKIYTANWYTDGDLCKAEPWGKGGETPLNMMSHKLSYKLGLAANKDAVTTFKNVSYEFGTEAEKAAFEQMQKNGIIG